MTYMANDELSGWAGDMLKKVGDFFKPSGGSTSEDRMTPPPQEPPKFPWVPIIVGGAALIMLIGVVAMTAKKAKEAK